MKFLEFDETIDFPFYRNNPRISKIGWIVLLLSVPISFLLYLVLSYDLPILGSVIFCLTMLIPLLYYSKWDYRLIFRKPTKNEIILAFLLFVGYMIYSISVEIVLDYAGFLGMDYDIESLGVTLERTIGLIFSMMGEELMKFIPLMFLMRLIYKFTDNRDLSIAFAAAIVLFLFGLMHYNPPYQLLISVLLVQGFGSLFEMYGYIKTKNLFVPYLTHLMTDALIFFMILIEL